MGRKSNGSASATRSFVIDDDLYEKIQAKAIDDDRTNSKTVNRILREYFADETKQ